MLSYIIIIMYMYAHVKLYIYMYAYAIPEAGQSELQSWLQYMYLVFKLELLVMQAARNLK